MDLLYDFLAIDQLKALTLEQVLPFAIFIFVSSTTPGPNNALLLSSGIRFGVMRSLPHLIGINIGFGIMFLLAGSVLLRLPAEMLEILRYIALGLIFYLSYKIASAPLPNFDKIGESKPWGFWKAAGFQWINPKAMMMVMGATAAYQLPPLLGTIMASSINASCIVYLVAGAALKQILQGNPRLLRAVYILLGLSLAATALL